MPAFERKVPGISLAGGGQFDVVGALNVGTYWVYIAFLLDYYRKRQTPGEDSVVRYEDIDRVECRTQYSYQIITLNYDLLIEKAVEFLNANFNAGVTIPIAKLHGSVDGTIVPPTWHKDISKKLKSSWKDAAKWLSEANEIRILGYSLPATDLYIKCLLCTALIESKNLQRIDVLCLDPLGEVRKRYERMFTFPEYNFYNTELKNYLNAFSVGGFQYSRTTFKTSMAGQGLLQMEDVKKGRNEASRGLRRVWR